MKHHAKMVIQGDGNVGIGTTTPVNKLSVAGNADFSGNVGIGTFNPVNKLSVIGIANFSGAVVIGNDNPDPSVVLDLSSTTRTGPL
jgi:hypothetical protein